LSQKVSSHQRTIVPSVMLVLKNAAFALSGGLSSPLRGLSLSDRPYQHFQSPGGLKNGRIFFIKCSIKSTDCRNLPLLSERRASLAVMGPLLPIHTIVP